MTRADWRGSASPFGEVTKEAVYLTPPATSRCAFPPSAVQTRHEVLLVAALASTRAARPDAGAYILTETCRDAAGRGRTDASWRAPPATRAADKDGEPLGNFGAGGARTSRPTDGPRRGGWGHLTGAASRISSWPPDAIVRSGSSASGGLERSPSRSTLIHTMVPGPLRSRTITARSRHWILPDKHEDREDEVLHRLCRRSRVRRRHHPAHDLRSDVSRRIARRNPRGGARGRLGGRRCP